jgi:hypothetical protein
MGAYESVKRVASEAMAGVTFTVRRMSFARRIELMRKLRDLGSRLEFLEAGGSAREQMEAGLLRAEIDRIYVEWGIAGVEGLTVDGEPAGPAELAERGPEELFREALRAVRAETGLDEAERKN